MGAAGAAIINSMGLIESASVGVVEKIIVFTMLVPTAFASAIAVMVAQNMGAKEVERAKKSLYVGIFYSLASLLSIIICLVYFKSGAWQKNNNL